MIINVKKRVIPWKELTLPKDKEIIAEVISNGFNPLNGCRLNTSGLTLIPNLIEILYSAHDKMIKSGGNNG